MIRLLVVLFALFGVVASVSAQQVPNHATPIGRGPGVTGFNSTGPGTAGNVLTSRGATLDPAYVPSGSGISVFVKGALGDALGEAQGMTDGAITTGTATFTSANATFLPTDCTGGSGCTGSVNKVIRIKAGATATISNASPAIVGWPNHGLTAGTPIYFYTQGTLPTPIVSGITYFVIAAGLGTNSFEISTTLGGAALNTSSAGSGIHNANASALLDTTITSFVNSHSVGLAANAAGTYNSARFSYGTNDTAAIQATITAAEAAGANTGCVYLPAVTFGYIITAELSITSGMCLTGDIGMGPFARTGSTLLPGKAIRAINVVAVDAVILRDFGVWYPFNADANVAAILIDSANSIYYPLIKDVTITNANIGFHVKNGTNVTIDNLQAYTYSNVGIRIENVNSPDGGGTNLINSAFSPVATTTPTATCIIWKSGGASRFVNNNCPYTNIGFSVAQQAASATGELQLVGNIFDTGNTCIQLTRDANTAFLISFLATGNQCNLQVVGLSVPTDGTGAWVTNLLWNSNIYRGPTSASSKAFVVDSVTNFLADGNLLFSGNAATVAYTIGSAVTSCTVGIDRQTGAFAASSFAAVCAAPMLGQLPGSLTSAPATAGNVGEVLTASATGVSLTSDAVVTIVSKALTVGDWDVWCSIVFAPAVTTGVIDVYAEVSPTNNTIFQTLGNYSRIAFSSAGLVSGTRKTAIVTPQVQVLLSTTTTYYCVSFAAFNTSTMTADGILTARRRR